MTYALHNVNQLSLDAQNRRREVYRARTPGWRPATEHFAARVRQNLPPDGRLLDIGCGRGGLVEQLAHPLHRCVGIDPDWQSLIQHRLPLPRAVALSGALPLAAQTIDVAYAAWVLEHLVAPVDDLRAIARVLKPGGVFVFITPNRRHPLVAANRLAGRVRVVQTVLVDRLYARAAADTFPAYYRANDAVALRRSADLAGLTLTQLDPIADPTYFAFSDRLFDLACRLEARLGPERKIHLVGVMQKP